MLKIFLLTIVNIGNPLFSFKFTAQKLSMYTFIRFCVFSVVVFLFGYDAHAQVAKNIIVEHFTNTWCSLCSNRNPGFYENLNKQTGVLHISYHPSRPYAGCELNKHNTAENDGRTHYYDVYGGTPRLIIQGTVVSGVTDYSDKAIFESHKGQTSPLSITIEQFKTNENIIDIKITITNEIDHTLAGVKIFAGIAEQLVQFNARNGEKEHFDVFRKAYTDIEGALIRLDKKQGAIMELNYQLPVNEAWILEELYSFVILQEEGSKAVVQAEVSKAGEFTFPVSVNEIENNSIHVFPNPVNDAMLVVLPTQETGYLKIYDCTGKLSMHTTFNDYEKVDMHSLNKGLYFIEIEQQGKYFQHKVLKN